MAEFVNRTFRFLIDTMGYIFNLRISDIPRTIAYVAIIAVVAYCTSLFLIGFPCSIWEALTKKKANDEKQSKVIRVAAIILFVLLLLWFLYEQVS